jgi:hypothetical protein
MLTFNHIGYLGRLGNQMFQFASTLGVANRLGIEARFPIENCISQNMTGPFDHNTGQNSYTKCDLPDCFNITDEYFIPSAEIKPIGIYHEREFTFNPETMSIPDDFTLFGYFQTEKYFSEYRNIILTQFSFKNEYYDIAADYIKTIKESNKDLKLTSLHVRRGDYVYSPDHHPVCSLTYYLEATKTINELGHSKSLVFSDDIEWCKKVFIGDAYILSDLENPYTEMCAMTLCDNNIIANSSFSWWGAWLNKNPDKIVISPSKWFGNAMNKDTSDVYCKDWIII